MLMFQAPLLVSTTTILHRIVTFLPTGPSITSIWTPWGKWGIFFCCCSAKWALTSKENYPMDPNVLQVSFTLSVIINYFNFVIWKIVGLQTNMALRSRPYFEGEAGGGVKMMNWRAAASDARTYISTSKPVRWGGWEGWGDWRGGFCVTSVLIFHFVQADLTAAGIVLVRRRAVIVTHGRDEWNYLLVLGEKQLQKPNASLHYSLF